MEKESKQFIGEAHRHNMQRDAQVIDDCLRKCETENAMAMLKVNAMLVALVKKCEINQEWC